MINNSRTLFAVIFIFLTLVSCFRTGKVIITRDYVINTYWGENHNYFAVVKKKLKDSSDKINLNNVQYLDLENKLENDSSWAYHTNINYNGEKYSKRKVYFSKDNGFSWSGYPNYFLTSKSILDTFQPETWYFLGGLGYPSTLYYIYLDSVDNFHVFKIPASDWSN